MGGLGFLEFSNRSRVSCLGRRVTTVAPGQRLGRGEKERESLFASNGLATRRA